MGHLTIMSDFYATHYANTEVSATLNYKLQNYRMNENRAMLNIALFSIKHDDKNTTQLPTIEWIIYKQKN